MRIAPKFAPFLILILTFAAMRTAFPESQYRIVSEQPAKSGSSSIAVRIREARPPDTNSSAIPARVIVTAGDGTYLDGAAHGLYGDGRFFVDGGFQVESPAGSTRVQISRGPEYVPLDFRLELKPDTTTTIDVELYRWFDASSRGWYSGDNHVHAQHDPTARVKTGLDYTALQARGNGLNFVTEAGSNVSYAQADQLDTPDFLLRVAREIRPACYTGHFITPGIREAIPKSYVELQALAALPGQAIKAEVHRRGGVAIYTHPLTPPHQLHWMGATGAFSDAVMGNCGDLMDLDSPQTEQLWFTLLNLGNRLGASSYTDCSLGRPSSLSPGDRRIYCQADRLDYSTLVAAMRDGRTFATNGGSIFPFLHIDGHAPGASIAVTGPEAHIATIEVQSLYPIKKVELIRNGIAVHSPKSIGNTASLETSWNFEESEDCWYVLRVSDERGGWGITSPIYFVRNTGRVPEKASTLVLAINNATRYTGLRDTFFAHMIATVSREQEIESVCLLRNGASVRIFAPAHGNSPGTGKSPVTTLNGDYEPAWQWSGAQVRIHFQADWPIDGSGWYALEIRTTLGLRRQTDAIYFDAANPNSQEICVARLGDLHHEFVLWGYGEEMPLANIKVPFEGDHWWYPNNTFWRVATNFQGKTTEMIGGSAKRQQLFRVSTRIEG